MEAPKEVYPSTEAAVGGEIALLMMVGAELAEVVDGAGTDGDRDRPSFVEGLVQHLDMVPVGVEFRLFEHIFFRGDACCGEGPEDLCAGGLPGIAVGYHEGLAAGEVFIEQGGNSPEYALTKFESLGVRRDLQGRCYSLF